jgi:23S rRNA (guanosine2251-2'-O)-methyltransferase
MRETLYGRNAVYETLRADRKVRRQLFGLQLAEGIKPTERIHEILRLAAERKVPVSRVPRQTLDKLDVNHQGVALEAGPYPYGDVADILDHASVLDEPPFILILDSLQDPQNFGTLLRTAEVAGVHGIIIPLARAVGVAPAVVNASAGASEHLLIAQSNLAQAMETLHEADVWLVGLDERGEPLGHGSERHLRGSLGLVVGSEGEGLHDLTRKKCDLLLRLPMRGRIASLNAAVAGSVAVYLAYLARQQQSDSP